jgi:alkylation response protein AidB-like acyl-CoA dehydrogenase
MAEAGWTSLLLPESRGGSGLTMREQAVLSEALGRNLISEPTAAICVFAGYILAEAPDSSETLRLAAALAGGEIISPAWLDASSPLRAARVGGGSSLEGSKLFVEGARAASSFLVTADHDGEPLLLSVPANADGITLTQRPTVDGAMIATLRFANCRVPGDAILARGAAATALIATATQRARLALAAELAGIAANALERTIRYVKDRVQFGKAIASFQVVQHRLVDMWMDAEFACASVVNAVEALGKGEAQAGELAVLAAKARAGDAAVSICRRGVHLHGAMGFTDECDIGLFLKRAIALDATLGQAETLRLEFLGRERAA